MVVAHTLSFDCHVLRCDTAEQEEAVSSEAANTLLLMSTRRNPESRIYTTSEGWACSWLVDAPRSSYLRRRLSPWPGPLGVAVSATTVESGDRHGRRVAALRVPGLQEILHATGWGIGFR